MGWLSALATRPKLSRPIRDLFGQASRPAPDWEALRAIVEVPDVAPEIASEALRLLRDDTAYASFADHERLSRQGNAPERLAFYAVSRLLGRASFDARAGLLAAETGETSPLDALAVDRRDGFLVTSQGDWAPVREAMEEARAAFARDAASNAPVNPGKTFMRTAKVPGDVMTSKIMALGRHPAVLRLVGCYLEGLPILYRINLLDSANDALQADSSQFFHIDPEDFRQMKIFLSVEDVGEDAGPLHVLGAAESDAVRVRLNHRLSRVSDEDALARASDDTLVRCTGPAGTMAIVDTSRCFHFGSRPGKRRRYVVMFQYLTPFAAAFPIDAKQVASKYAERVQRAADAAGAPLGDREAHLFGLRR